MTIQQGHKYKAGSEVGIAVEVGPHITVLREILPDLPWIGRRIVCANDRLIAQPMKYFGGEVPQ